MKTKTALYTLLPVFLLLFLSPSAGAQSMTRTVYGKIYYTAKGQRYPAAYKRVVLMPNTTANLTLAKELYNRFDDSTIKKIRGAKSMLTSGSGEYEFNNIGRGSYIIRVTGAGGMVIRFSIITDNYTRKKIPDMPANYY